jgi:hypothetical protein
MAVFAQTASFLIALLCAPTKSPAMDSTEVLPAKVNSPAFRYGLVSGVDSKFLSDGSVRDLNDINTVRFDSQQLARMNPEVTQLVNILDQFSRQRLGSQLNLGTLRVSTQPRVSYFVPIYARGISDRLSLAIALPIVFYSNELRITQSASNVPAICAQFLALQEDIPDLKTACESLSIKITDATRAELAKKGYRPIQDRKETVPGDIQLLGLWKAFDNGLHSTMIRTTLGLPTGQSNDPDDLADLGIFGQRMAETVVLYNYLPLHWLRLAVKTGYRMMIPDQVVMRVPKDEGDILPDSSQKVDVSRNLGDTWLLGGAINVNLFSSFAMAAGYERLVKSADSFSGGSNLRYDLLGKDSSGEAERLRMGLTYDTISLYQRTKAFPPLKFDYEWLNTFAGRNNDRQFVHEFSVTFFF